jgi:hypothetical protein
VRPIVLAGLSGAIICAWSATAAWSQNALPTALDRAALTSWLRANTDLDPNNVISVSPANIIGVIAVAPVEAPGKRVYRAQIRSEVISAETIRDAGNSSWAADVEVDCQARRGKVNRILDFPQRNLRGAAREAGGSAEWVAPPAGTHLYTVVAAVCDAGFQRPLATSQQAFVAPAAPPRAGGSAPASGTVATAPRVPAAQANQAATPAVAKAPPPAAAPRAPTPGAKRSLAAVQIAAADTEAKATQALRAALAAFGDRLGGATLSTAQVEVQGRTVYRALVHGFSSDAEASAFCSAYKAAGRDCFLRQSAPGNAKAIASR